MRTSIVLAAILATAGLPAFAQSAPPLRIGVFDSRAVALAYRNSDEFKNSIARMYADLQAAKAAKDENRVKELEQELPWEQVRAHQQVFSTGPVGEIVAKVKDQLPAIAAQAGVSLIVSKWEVQFHNPKVELVDVTAPLAMLFHPSAQVLQWMNEMKAKDPIPFSELPLDPKM
jgi:hypothetical protein